MLGDCVHNFRAALDYVASGLVYLNGHAPSNRTAYPMRPGDRVDGTVSRQARKVINEIYAALLLYWEAWAWRRSCSISTTR
jgi:hypothetical protein